MMCLAVARSGIYPRDRRVGDIRERTVPMCEVCCTVAKGQLKLSPPDTSSPFYHNRYRSNHSRCLNYTTDDSTFAVIKAAHPYIAVVEGYRKSQSATTLSGAYWNAKSMCTLSARWP